MPWVCKYTCTLFGRDKGQQATTGMYLHYDDPSRSRCKTGDHLIPRTTPAPALASRVYNTISHQDESSCNLNRLCERLFLRYGVHLLVFRDTTTLMIPLRAFCVPFVQTQVHSVRYRFIVTECGFTQPALRSGLAKPSKTLKPSGRADITSRHSPQFHNSPTQPLSIMHSVSGNYLDAKT